MRIEGALFDVDDTLVDTASAFAAALGAAFGALTDLTAGAHEEIVQIWRADAGGHFRRYVAGEVDMLTQRRARVLEITRHLRLEDLDDDGFSAFEDAYQEAFRASWALYADARDGVDAAFAAGLSVGVVTNAPGEIQRAKLTAVGLEDLLPTLVAFDSVGVGKPDPRIFLEACRLIGTAPEVTLYVGDELDTDALGAAAAGLHGVWLDRPGRRRSGPHEVTPQRLEQARREGVQVITSLRELPAHWGATRA